MNNTIAPISSRQGISRLISCSSQVGGGGAGGRLLERLLVEFVDFERAIEIVIGYP
jgi:hypothetical protein